MKSSQSIGLEESTAASKIQLRQHSISPPLFLAPMAGITHSAFRRLVAGFGGYGALYTEMLPTQTLLSENLLSSPYTKRREAERNVIYQLVSTGTASIEKAVARLTKSSPTGIDINLGCPAPMISRKGGGKALFDDLSRLREVLTTVRALWNGPLTVKCRIGHQVTNWKEQFLLRLAVFHDAQVDGLIVHPRFFHEKLKRKARWSLFAWLRSQTELPLIGNGDMVDRRALDLLQNGVCDGLMIGRAAVRRPWIFAELCGKQISVDYLQVWERFYRYSIEDFPPERAIGKIKEFTTYYSKNFFFGHELFRRVQSANNLETIQERARRFFETDPKVMRS